jgi:anthranilate/para-aminobenzoate synthase component I
MIAIETRLPARPLDLARRAWRGSGAMLLWTRDGSGPSYVACDPCQLATGLDPEAQLESSVGLGRWASLPRWLGVLPYEAQRQRLERQVLLALDERPPPLVRDNQWWRYPAVAVVDSKVTIAGDDRDAVDALRARLMGPPVPGAPPELHVRDMGGSDEQHRRCILRALEFIREGETYQINLARRLEFAARGGCLELLEQISDRARSPYCAAFVTPTGQEIVSTSPELFLQLEPDRRVVTVPIKGTRPRGNDANLDRQLALELDQDDKERAELAMVVDIERNDLGRVAATGSVVAEPARVVRHTGVFHRQARVSARLREGVDRAELLRATLPSGSITGAPKVRTMELIRTLESNRRGLYTGSFGVVTQGGGLNLAMAIRTLCRDGDVAHYWVGGGIVLDSDPDREVEETRWKASQLERLLRAGPKRVGH